MIEGGEILHSYRSRQRPPRLEWEQQSSWLRKYKQSW